jgi:outer membrane autotransporter protein
MGAKMFNIGNRVERPIGSASGRSAHLARMLAGASTAAVAVVLLSAGAASAQDCSSLDAQLGFTQPFLDPTVRAAAGAVSTIAGSLGNVSTAFLSQQTSAFVAASKDGGVWGRAVGGRVETKSETAVNGALVAPVFIPGSGTCTSSIKQNYWGFQAGRDLAQVIMNDWTLHWGTTVGYLESRGGDIPTASIQSEFQVPFIGTYLVATAGNFFSDLVVRRDFYNATINQPALNLHNQQFGARGWSVSVGAGYNFGLLDGWFVEPSAGFFWSRTEVDQLTIAGVPDPVSVPPNSGIQGTLAINDIDSKIGRATLRVGRNFSANGMAWQPFASVSVFREFAGDVTSNYTTCTNCGILVTDPATITAQSATSRVGTYAQYSLGLAGQVINTGWVGFVRGDYRKGDNIDGWTANAGLRYNLTPDAPAPVYKMVTKGPPPPIRAPYIWSGWYVGGHFGVGQGRGHIDFAGTGVNIDPYISGYLLGGQIGFNFQNGPWVLGVEGEFSKTNIKGTQTCGTDQGFDLVPDPVLGIAGGNFRFAPLFLTCENDLKWIATAAARVGVISWWSDRVLLFAKAGGAWTKEDTNIGCVFGPGNNDPLFAAQCVNPAVVRTGGFSSSDSKFGGLIGVGTELGLTPNWSAKAEFTWIRFRDDELTASDGTRLSTGASVTTAKIGVNYRFGPVMMP